MSEVSPITVMTDRKHCSVQPGMVLEKELRVLHLDLKAAGRDIETLGIA